MKTLLLLLTGLFLLHPASEMQMQVDNSKTQLIISGTSSLHDWDIEAEECSGNATMLVEDGNLTGIKKLTFRVKVSSLESGKSAMNSNTEEALKEEDHPYITFELIEIIPLENREGEQLFKAKGKLTIAGTTRVITMNTSIETLANSVNVKGDIKLKMTDFNVDPPTAMFGTITTGNEVAITFNTTYTN